MSANITFEPLKKAANSLHKVLQEDKNEFIRDAAIRRFEYTYELTWKMLKRVLKLFYGIEEGNIKNIYRQAFKNHLINDLERWFSYHSARNLTSHTYNEETAEETYDVIEPFYKDVEALLVKLESIKNAD